MKRREKKRKRLKTLTNVLSSNLARVILKQLMGVVGKLMDVAAGKMHDQDCLMATTINGIGSVAKTYRFVTCCSLRRMSMQAMRQRFLMQAAFSMSALAGAEASQLGFAIKEAVHSKERLEELSRHAADKVQAVITSQVENARGMFMNVLRFVPPDLRTEIDSGVTSSLCGVVLGQLGPVIQNLESFVLSKLDGFLTQVVNTIMALFQEAIKASEMLEEMRVLTDADAFKTVEAEKIYKKLLHQCDANYQKGIKFVKTLIAGFFEILLSLSDSDSKHREVARTAGEEEGGATAADSAQSTLEAAKEEAARNISAKLEDAQTILGTVKDNVDTDQLAAQAINATKDHADTNPLAAIASVAVDLAEDSAASQFAAQSQDFADRKLGVGQATAAIAADVLGNNVDIKQLTAQIAEAGAGSSDILNREIAQLMAWHTEQLKNAEKVRVCECACVHMCGVYA